MESGCTACSPAVNGIGVNVVGGSLAAAGDPQTGRTAIFGGSGANNYISNSVSNGGNLMVQDYWYDTGSSGNGIFATIADNSQFTLEGSSIHFSQGNGPIITVSNFNGNGTILNNTLSDVVQVTGTGSGNVWLAGNTTDTTIPLPHQVSYLVNYSSRTTGIFTSNRYQTGSGSYAAPDIGTASAAFVEKMLMQDRASRATNIADVSGGVTDVKLYRVFINRASYGIHISK
jgi:hypothetical protein